MQPERRGSVGRRWRRLTGVWRRPGIGRHLDGRLHRHCRVDGVADPGGRGIFDHIRRRLDARLAGISSATTAPTWSSRPATASCSASARRPRRCAARWRSRAPSPAATAATPSRVALRIGISVGDAAAEDGDLHGTAVVEAARLCAVAEAGRSSAPGRSARCRPTGRGPLRRGPRRRAEGHPRPGDRPRGRLVDRAPARPDGPDPLRRARPLRIERDGQPVAVGGPKERLVLACSSLATRNSTMSVDALVDQVWGDDPPRTAERTIHAYIARLRRALEPDERRDADGARDRRSGLPARGRAGQLDAGRFEAAGRDGLEQLRQGDPAGAAATLRRGAWPSGGATPTASFPDVGVLRGRGRPARRAAAGDGRGPVRRRSRRRAGRRAVCPSSRPRWSPSTRSASGCGAS